MKTRAFTLVEVIIVTVIITMLSLSLALSLTATQDRALFEEQELALISLLQDARALSLQNTLIDDEEVTHYELEVTERELNLYAHTSGRTQLENLRFESASLTPEIEIYYFPPDGTLCFFQEDCSDPEESVQFTLSHHTEDLSSSYELSIYGGYPELLSE